MGDATTLAVKREKLLKRFNQMGVESERVLAVLERQSLDSIDLDDLANLIGIGAAIKDGELSIDNAFPPVRRERERGTVDLKYIKGQQRSEPRARPDRASGKQPENC